PKMSGTAIVSLVLVVGVVIGLVAIVQIHDSKEERQKITTTSKSVVKMCAPTDYKEACEKSLGSVNSTTDDPKEYIKAAILATVDAATKAFGVSDDLIIEAAANSSEPAIKMALGDCNDLLQDAVAELQASLSTVGDSEMHTMDQRIAELQNWLSAVISYQETCRDQFGEEDSQFKSAMNNGMLDAGQLTSNALAMIDTMSDILKAFDLQFNFPNITNSRRLLSFASDGHPTWIPETSRRLLETPEGGILEPNATVALDGTALGDGFAAKNIGFENTAGPKGHQAVALRVQADKAAFVNCRIDGYQDTLYTQAHRQLYHNCTISGTIDFIFGDASAVIQNSLIIVRRPMDNQKNTVTAQGRKDKHETTGLVLKNCKIVAEDKLVPDKAKIPSYLGRPWKAYSRTIIMESEIGDVIRPEGWLPWLGDLYLDTLYFAEYRNRGAGAKTDKRPAAWFLLLPICAATDFKEICEKVLGVVDSPDPKEYIKQAILSTAEAAQKAFNLSGELVTKAGSNPEMKVALEDCEDLLQDAVQELQASFSTVGESELHTIDKRIEELQNWLSAVISYQETCKDQFGQEDSEYKTEMSNGMLDAGQLTSNALAIIGSISKILKLFDLQISFPFFPNGRRLLSFDDDGYPSWLPATSRKLMGMRGHHRGRGGHHGGGGGHHKLKPNAVVAKDGSGQYMTIMSALAAVPPNNQQPFIIYVKAGEYREYVIVGKKMFNVFMYGDGPDKTIVTGDHCNRNGYKTMNSATFAALGDGFVAKNMAFVNTAGPQGHQAVALRVQADKAAFVNCRMEGYQDTLYTQAHRQLYNNCTISGTIDFIFGDASAVIQNSLIVVRRPMDNQQNTVTAQGRKDRHETTGLVLQNCRIVAEDKLVPDIAKIPSYLGRPWKEYSRAIIMESEISDMGGCPGPETLPSILYTSPSMVTEVPVPTLTRGSSGKVLQYTAGQFLQGQEWLNETHGAYNLGLTT
ncbi:hypothetical protein Tsubulata_028442, partial [Turnera subulata]